MVDRHAEVYGGRKFTSSVAFFKAWDMVAAQNFDAPETLVMYVASYEKSCHCLKLVIRVVLGASNCQLGQREVDVMSHPVA